MLKWRMECMPKQYVDVVCVRAHSTSKNRHPNEYQNDAIKLKEDGFFSKCVMRPDDTTSSRQKYDVINTARDFDSAFDPIFISFAFYFKLEICNYTEYL